MKNHTRYGKKILGNSVRLSMATEVAHNHHESWDGKGYPKGIKGEEIPGIPAIFLLPHLINTMKSWLMPQIKNTMKIFIIELPFLIVRAIRGGANGVNNA